MENSFDVIVIGAGSGGLTVAIGLSAAGKAVALIEKARIGGDCTNFGCVPSKALIDIAKQSPGIGIKTALEEVRKRRNIFRKEESPKWIEKFGITLFKGNGNFLDKNTISLSGKENIKIKAKNIIISTGSHGTNYEMKGLEKNDILTNENIFELEENIKNLIVIGGGYIGCELAESVANLGVKVTIVQRNKALIPREEQESSDILEKIFRQKGLDVFKNSTVDKVVYDSNKSGKLHIVNKITLEKKEIPFDKILVALGRGANVENLNLEKVGIEFSKKGIKVDKYSRTKTKSIFAIGDCVEGNPQFTHWANNEGRGVIRNILLPFWKTSVRNTVLPSTLYTNIEVARVGKTKKQLLINYNEKDIITKIIHFNENDRSKLTKDEIGFVKINFKRLSGKVLGASIVGTRAGDMLPILTSAMQNNISAYKLSSLVYPYPTKAELIKRVADQFVVKTIGNISGEVKYFLKDNILQIITAVIWISLVLTFLYTKSKLGLTNIEIAQKVYLFVETNYWGPIIYIFIYTIRPIILFPATFMTFMSGALFGPLGGFAYTMIGENMSANFAYLLGRIFGKKLIKPESNGIFSSLKQKLSGSSFMPILMTRLLFFPFDIVNYASGILKVQWKGFFLATIIGIIPGALMFILAGASVENASEFDFSKISFDKNLLLIAFGLFVGSLILAKFLKKKGF